jgi:hypothetical protein
LKFGSFWPFSLNKDNALIPRARTKGDRFILGVPWLPQYRSVPFLQNLQNFIISSQKLSPYLEVKGEENFKYALSYIACIKLFKVLSDFYEGKTPTRF